MLVNVSEASVKGYVRLCMRVKVIDSDHPKHVCLSLLWYNCSSVLYYLGSLLTICRTHVLLLYYLYRASFHFSL